MDNNTTFIVYEQLPSKSIKNCQIFPNFQNEYTCTVEKNLEKKNNFFLFLILQ